MIEKKFNLDRGVLLYLIAIHVNDIVKNNLDNVHDIDLDCYESMKHMHMISP